MNAFGTAQAQLAKYGYERLVYTWGPQALLTGLTPVFSASRWNRAGLPTWQAELTMLAATQSASVLLLPSGDPSNQTNPVNEGYTSAMPAGVRQQQTFLPAIDRLALNLQNIGGSAVSDFQLNYAVSMRRLFAADKILAQRAGLQGYLITREEQQALKALDLAREVNGQLIVDMPGLERLRRDVSKGTRPLSLSLLLDGRYENRMLQGPVDLFSIDVDTQDRVVATYQAQLDRSEPTRGRFLVLREIAVPGAAPATIRIDRDGDLGYLELNGAAFAQADGASWEVWVPAISHLTIRAQATASTTLNLRLRVLSIAMSEILAVQFGLVTRPDQLAEPELYWQVLAGVI